MILFISLNGDDTKFQQNDIFLAHLFQRKSQAILIAGPSLLLSCKNFNVTHCSKSIEYINTKLGILAHSSNNNTIIIISWMRS